MAMLTPSTDWSLRHVETVRTGFTDHATNGGGPDLRPWVSLKNGPADAQKLRGEVPAFNGPRRGGEGAERAT